MSESQINIPHEFYIYINFSNPVTRHNIEFTKCIVSSAFTNFGVVPGFVDDYINGTVNYLAKIVEMDEKEPNGGGCVSLHSVGLLRDYPHGGEYNFQVDVDAEKIRMKYFPRMPSRLSAIYAFGDKESYMKANELHGWDLKNLRKFRLIDTPLNKVARANMEIISYARNIYKKAILTDEEKEKMYMTYWSGSEGKDYPVDVLWEYLIEGKLVLIE